MLYYKTPGIILKSEPYQESDRIYTIYTEKYGKMRAMAKGVRKIKSKLAGHLEPFNLVNLMIVKGRALDKIINAVNINSFPEIKKDLEKIASGSYILEVVDVLTKEHHRDERIFELLREALKNLEGFGEFPRKSVFADNRSGFTRITTRMNAELISSFVLCFLSFLGYKPELYQCVHCKSRRSRTTGLKPKSQYYFSPKLGGLLCSQCKKFDQESLMVSEEGIEILRKILLDRPVRTPAWSEVRTPAWSEVGTFSSTRVSPTRSPEVSSPRGAGMPMEIKKIIDSFLKYRLEKELKTEKFLINLIPN